MTDQGVAAALQQLAELRDTVSKVQDQVASNWVKVIARLRELAHQMEAAGESSASHGDTLVRLEASVTALEEQLSGRVGSSESDKYAPIPAPRWWHMEGEERQAAVDRLADWISAVYTPGYGRLAARLPACWAEHPLCLFALDWLSEMHSVLYLQAERSAGTLAAQAEWQTRLLPAAVDQMADECHACAHDRAWRNGTRP
jgi:hypothetical protein